MMQDLLTAGTRLYESPFRTEIVTQKRLINLLSQTMGYDYLGEWKEEKTTATLKKHFLG